MTRSGQLDVFHDREAALRSFRALRTLVALVVTSLVIGVVAGVAIDGDLWAATPVPLTFVLPAMELEALHLPLSVLEFSVPLLAMLSFVISAVPILVRGSSRPLLSFGLYVAASALTPAYFLFGWEYGVQVQGLAYTRTLVIANVLAACGLLVLLLLAWRRPTPARAWSFHFLLFLWLSWFAFPWLGEVP